MKVYRSASAFHRLMASDGFNFVRRVKGDARLASLPFVFISSSIWGDADRERAIGLGVTRFLLRPIEPQMLIHEVGAALEQGSEPRSQ